MITEEIKHISKYHLKSPIAVSIIEIEGYYYATNSDFDICESGNSSEEALENFKKYLEKIYKRAMKLVEKVEN